MASPRPVSKLIPRLVLLYFLFLAFYVMGALFVSVPEAAVSGMAGSETAVSEPGLVAPTSGLLLIALVNLMIIIPLIQTSRWGGWKLALILALSYYGAATFVVQLESWYFLSLATSTVDAQTLPGLFLMGIPPAFFFIPLAVWLLGKNASTVDTTPKPVMPLRQWLWKLITVVAAYLLLYGSPDILSPGRIRCYAPIMDSPGRLYPSLNIPLIRYVIRVCLSCRSCAPCYTYCVWHR